MISAPGGRPVSAWLASPPSVRTDTDLLLALLDDLLAVLRPYDIREIESSEPRIYRLTPRGRALLREALAAQRLRSVQFDSSRNGAAGSASVLLDLGLAQNWLEGLAVRLDVRVVPGPGVPPDEMLLQCARFVTRWVVPLQAASAFISDRAGDYGVGTVHEYRQRQPALVTWPAVCRYVRGTFWGMSLGAALCDRLGGQTRVLRDAPVVVVEPLGDGVWLQLSKAPPAEQAAYDRLAAYLEPLLHWTMKDVQTLRPVTRPSPPVMEDVTTPPKAMAGPAVPVRIQGTLEADLAINLHLGTLPTAAQQAAIEQMLRAWHEEGFAGAFGGTGFHFLSEASVDVPGRVLRWSADLGSADVRRAIQALAERLGRLEGVAMEQLIIGTEQVG